MMCGGGTLTESNTTPNLNGPSLYGFFMARTLTKLPEGLWSAATAARPDVSEIRFPGMLLCQRIRKIDQAGAVQS